MSSSILRFSLVFTLVSIAIPLFVFAASAVFDVDLSGSFVHMVPFIAGAIFEGQRYAQQFDEMPAKSEMWNAALIMACVGMVISLVWAALLFFALPSLSAPLRDIPILFLAIGFCVILLIAFLMCRVFVALGARTYLKNSRRST
ncbi:ABZJ_00895 family protein [Ruegeria meonggei]|uniref:ABZJ_00895 family protein n=1 Tax=Ruegeria meonggei TaxID=1446476 RepID=UPI00366ECFB8